MLIDAKMVERFIKVMVVLGSGGHTFEMFHLIKNIDQRYSPKIYIMAETDTLSEQKAVDFEISSSSSTSYSIEKMPRSREVGQSWFSTLFTTLRSLIFSFSLIFKHKPEVVLCNGPGTCVPLCVVAFIFRILRLKHIKTIYIESICRVKTMSMSGKILYRIADEFLVQWPQLVEKYPRSKYIVEDFLFFKLKVCAQDQD